MESAEYYQKKAAELRQQALSVSTPTIKEQFLNLALEYDALAIEAATLRKPKTS